MKVLIACLEPPWPPSYGVQLRCWETVSLVAEIAEVAVFSVTGRTPPPDGWLASAWCPAGAEVQHTPAIEWMKQDNAVPTDGFYSERAADKLRELLKSFQPDVAILETLSMHRYENLLREHGVRVVLNAHNVETDVARQELERETLLPVKLQRRLLTQRLEQLEAAIANRVDQIWVCSTRDGRMFQENYLVKSAIHVVPNAADARGYQVPQPRPASLAAFRGPCLLFPGDFSYPPNRRAVEFLMRDVFPNVAQAHSNVCLVLAGPNPTPEMLNASAADSRIVITGRVPDMIPYFQHCSMALVPLQEGGGTRFKIIEAFAAKLPVVSSAKGAEGLAAQPGEHFLLAEDRRDYCDAVDRLVGDPEFSSRMTRAASEFQATRLWGGARRAIRNALADLDPNSPRTEHAVRSLEI